MKIEILILNLKKYEILIFRKEFFFFLKKRKRKKGIFKFFGRK